jgi:cell wall-associated NlpC family hydrolase
MRLADALKQIDDYIAQVEQENERLRGSVSSLQQSAADAQNAVSSLQSELIKQTHVVNDLTRQQTTQRVIGVALCFDYQDIQYVFGGTWDTTKTFDCSAMMQICFKIGTQGKVLLPRTSHEQSLVGVAVDPSSIEVGDTLHYDFDGDGRITHVGMAMGDGMMIHTNNPTNDINIIAIADYNRSKLVAVRRHIL